jgi:hypothetical protein
MSAAVIVAVAVVVLAGAVLCWRDGRITVRVAMGSRGFEYERRGRDWSSRSRRWKPRGRIVGTTPPPDPWYEPPEPDAGVREPRRPRGPSPMAGEVGPDDADA